MTANGSLELRRERPQVAGSDCKWPLLGEVSSQSCGKGWNPWLVELPLMLLSQWPLTSSVTCHCSALTANSRRWRDDSAFLIAVIRDRRIDQRTGMPGGHTLPCVRGRLNPGRRAISASLNRKAGMQDQAL